MANKSNNRRANSQNSRNKNTKNNDRVKALKKLAFDMGCVQRGLKNPNSQLTSSYNAGLTKTKKEKKPLF